MEETTCDVELPGFRFHPTEEELLDFYLKNTVVGKKLFYDVIGFLNIYRHHPWDLPGLAKIGEREWYFFVPRDRKHGSGGRPNRTTEHGFWKATGSDRRIFSLSDPKRVIGLKKTLVFYKGRAPRGCKTDWVMNEYRLPDKFSPSSSSESHKDIVLCKIYRKATSLKVLEQRAAMEEDSMMKKAINNPSYRCPPPPAATALFCPSLNTMNSLCSQPDDKLTGTEPPLSESQTVMKHEVENVLVFEEQHEDTSAGEVVGKEDCSWGSQLSSGHGVLAELQVPKFSMMDFTQDPFWTQLRSPWPENLNALMMLSYD